MFAKRPTSQVPGYSGARLNRNNPLGRIAESVWYPADLSGIAAGSNIRASGHASVVLRPRDGRPAFNNTDANQVGSTATIAPLQFPWVQFCQFYVDATPGFVPTQPCTIAGSGSHSFIQCGSSTLISGGVRFNFGASRPRAISVTGGRLGKLLNCVFLVKSETEQVLFVNGQSGTNTSSPGTYGGQLGTITSPIGTMNGSVLLSGYGRGMIPDAYALMLSANPAAWSDIFAPRRIWVPAEVASSGVTGTSATTNANDTTSASGTTTVVGAAATTNANDTATASGVVGSPVIGTGATTNANDTPSASGTTTVIGTSATTNSNDASAASGWAGAVSGTAAVTNADDAAQASGTVEGGFPFGGTGGGLAQIKPRESDEQKRTRRIAQGIIREAQKPSADVGKLAKKAGKVSAQLRADVSYYEAEAAKYAKEIEQSKQAIALVMQARNDALATRQLEQRMIQAQLLAEAAAQQIEELDVVFMAVMLAALE